jgi:deoxyhypusine synthase
MKKVSDIKLKECMTADELVRQMYESGGFTAKKLGVGVNILENMVKDEDCKVFLSFPACIISTGTRGVIKDLIKNKLVDAVITTCGTLDHDLARVWKDYYHGDFLMDDKKLHKKGVNRLGNVLIPNECYGLILEEKMQPVISEIYNEGKKELSTKDIIWEFGKRIDNEDSIIHWAYKNQIPIYVPGITDGAFGSQLWMFWQEHKDFKINLFEDEQELMNMVFDAKKSGALMIGGGISKHHVIWWNQFRDGLDYVVYITTAPEYDGSLSGAPVREAVSWGKVKENAKFVTIEGDATIILPLMAAALLERLKL